MPDTRGGLAPTLLLALAVACEDEFASDAAAIPDLDPIVGPTDFSGLAWLSRDTAAGTDLFLAVHDAKAEPAELDRPRVSLVRTPSASEGLAWAPLDLAFPADRVANDLESVARIPGRDLVLLVESGDGGDAPGDVADADAAIHVASFEDGVVEVLSSTRWPATPTPLVNVEATAVAEGAEQLWFLYAERASEQDTTEVRWTTLDVRPDGTLAFGESWRSVPFTRPGPEGARPASALEVGPDGRVHVASAFDPDDDRGPFASAVWWIGTWDKDAATIALLDEPVEVARVDGFKVEAVAASAAGALFVGVDDELYGATLRPLRAP